jgi:hypothetical protein
MTNPAPSTGIPVVDFVYIYSEHSDVPSAGMGVLHTYLGGQAQTIVLPLTPSANSRFSAAAMPIKLYIDNQSSILLNTNTNGSCLFTVVGHTVTP